MGASTDTTKTSKATAQEKALAGILAGVWNEQTGAAITGRASKARRRARRQQMLARRKQRSRS